MLNEARSLVESLQSLLNRTTTSGATATSGAPLVTAATATVATPVPTAHAGTSRSLKSIKICLDINAEVPQQVEVGNVEQRKQKKTSLGLTLLYVSPSETWIQYQEIILS